MAFIRILMAIFGRNTMLCGNIPDMARSLKFGKIVFFINMYINKFCYNRLTINTLIDLSTV